MLDARAAVEEDAGSYTCLVGHDAMKSSKLGIRLQCLKSIVCDVLMCSLDSTPMALHCV